MTTLTNKLHGTKATIRANVGDVVSAATRNRVRRALCGISDCRCSGADGTRESEYRLVEMGRGEITVARGDYHAGW